MSPLESAIRHGSYRDTLRSIRKCWASLASGNIPAAIDHRDAATRTLSFTKGLFAHRVSVSATCRLERALIELGMALDEAVGEALRPAPEADPADLIEQLAEGVRVLRVRDGMDLGEEAVFERARNMMTGLIANFDVTEKRPATRRLAC